MEREEIGIGSEVYFPGLFVHHHGRNEPIVRGGIVSSMPTEPVLTEFGEIHAYLAEARSVGGLSGSPVIVDNTTPFRIDDQGNRSLRTRGKAGTCWA